MDYALLFSCVAERSLEDHEDVLSVYRDMQSFCKYSERRFVFRKDYRKYEFLHNPEVIEILRLSSLPSFRLLGLLRGVNRSNFRGAQE